VHFVAYAICSSKWTKISLRREYHAREISEAYLYVPHVTQVWTPWCSCVRSTTGVCLPASLTWWVTYHRPLSPGNQPALSTTLWVRVVMNFSRWRTLFLFACTFCCWVLSVLGINVDCVFFFNHYRVLCYRSVRRGTFGCSAARLRGLPGHVSGPKTGGRPPGAPGNHAGRRHDRSKVEWRAGCPPTARVLGCTCRQGIQQQGGPTSLVAVINYGKRNRRNPGPVFSLCQFLSGQVQTTPVCL